MLLLLLLVVGGVEQVTGFEQQGQTFSDISVTSDTFYVDMEYF